MELFLKKKSAAGAAAGEGQLPEQVFTQSVQAIAMEYLKAKFPYVLDYPGKLDVQKVDLDNNKMIMGYSIFADDGTEVGRIPILFGNGKIIEPWTIFVNSDKMLKPLSEDFLEKIYRNSVDSNGSMAGYTSTVPERANYGNEKEYRADTLTATNNRRYAALNRLRLKEIASIIKASHKNAHLYLSVGRIATKIAAGRLLKPKSVRKTRTVYNLKKGCLAIEDLSELKQIRASKKSKKAALDEYYKNGKQEVFMFGEDQDKSAFTDITEKVNTNHDFEASNIYIDILAKDNPVVCSINKNTGEEMFFIKKDGNNASAEVSRAYFMTREVLKDDIVKRWNKPEHSFVTVAPVNWPQLYAEKMEGLKSSGNKLVEKIVTEGAKKGRTVLKAEAGDPENCKFVCVPENPKIVHRGDYGYAVTIDVFKDSVKLKGARLSIMCSDELFFSDISKYEDGMICTKRGERFYLLDLKDITESDVEDFDGGMKELAMQKQIYIDTPDNCFNTKASKEMSVIGYRFLSDSISLNDTAKMTMWVNKTGSNKFALGIGEATNVAGYNVVTPISLGTVPRKTAGIMLGLMGKTDNLFEFLDNHPVGWRHYVSKSKSAILRKIAQDPAMIQKLLGGLAEQAKVMEGEGVTINIENINLGVPDIAKNISEGRAQAVDDPTGQAPEVGALVQELMTLGVDQATVDRIVGLAVTTGKTEEELLTITLEFVQQSTAEGVPIPNIVQQLSQMIAEMEGQVQAPAPAPAPVEAQAPVPVEAQAPATMPEPVTEPILEQGQVPMPEQAPPLMPEQAPAPGQVPVQGQTPMPSMEEMLQALLGMGITQQTIDIILQISPVLQVSPEEVIVEAGSYAEEAVAAGKPIEQVNTDLQNNAQQMLQNTSPEMMQAAAVPSAQAMGGTPMAPGQEQAVMAAGQQVMEAVPMPPAQTPAYDASNRAAAVPGMGAYDEQMNTVREGGLIADIIGNAVIKTKFMDYLPTLNDTLNTVSELILKIELAKADLINDVGVDNVDKVLGELRDVNQMIGNLILSIGSFE